MRDENGQEEKETMITITDRMKPKNEIGWFTHLSNFVLGVVESQQFLYGIVFEISIHASVIGHIPAYNAKNLNSFSTYFKIFKQFNL